MINKKEYIEALKKAVDYSNPCSVSVSRFVAYPDSRMRRGMCYWCFKLLEERWFPWLPKTVYRMLMQKSRKPRTCGIVLLEQGRSPCSLKRPA